MTTQLIPLPQGWGHILNEDYDQNLLPSYFIDKKPKVQRGLVTDPRSHSQLLTDRKIISWKDWPGSLPHSVAIPKVLPPVSVPLWPWEPIVSLMEGMKLPSLLFWGFSPNSVQLRPWIRFVCFFFNFFF